jgi:hypothetical protein
MTSGDIIWIVDAVGDPKAIRQCLDSLAKSVHQGKQIRIFASGNNNPPKAGV